jgi:hypothetical protein
VRTADIFFSIEVGRRIAASTRARWAVQPFGRRRTHRVGELQVLVNARIACRGAAREETMREVCREPEAGRTDLLPWNATGRHPPVVLLLLRTHSNGPPSYRFVLSASGFA